MGGGNEVLTMHNRRVVASPAARPIFSDAFLRTYCLLNDAGLRRGEIPSPQQRFKGYVGSSCSPAIDTQIITSLVTLGKIKLKKCIMSLQRKLYYYDCS